jgi:S-adenosylmethionine hydrolase
MTRPIFLLTDFGLADTYVGVVKAVILRIAPDAPLVDLTHEIPPQDVRAGAFALLTAVPYLPTDAVVLAVVDPSVGTARRPVAIEAGGRIFVGPDNGLMSWAVDGLAPPPAPLPSAEERGNRMGALPSPAKRGRGPQERGGAAPGRREGPTALAAVLDRPQFWLPTISASFHGRDLFGPVAAHLARGVPLADVGSPVDSIVELPFPMPARAVDVVHGEVIHVDRFGNLITNLTAGDLPADPVVTVAERSIVGLAPHFQSAGLLIAMIGSAGFLEVAVPNGSAAATLGVGVGAPVDARSS